MQKCKKHKISNKNWLFEGLGISLIIGNNSQEICYSLVSLILKTNTMMCYFFCKIKNNVSRTKGVKDLNTLICWS